MKKFDFDETTDDLLSDLPEITDPSRMAIHAPPWAEDTRDAKIWIQLGELHILPSDGGLLVVKLKSMEIEGNQYIYGDDCPYPD
jgi:hypothetical protein